MAIGEMREKVEDIPTLAFSTVCGELGLTSESEVMSAYRQIRDVLWV